MPERIFKDRDKYERWMARELAEYLGVTMREALLLLGADMDYANITAEHTDKWKRLLILLMTPILIEQFVDVGVVLGEALIPVDTANLSLLAADWARANAGAWLTGVHQTGIDGLQRYVQLAIEDGWSVAELRNALQPIFGPARAEMIAITEATRATMQGSYLYGRQLREETGQQVQLRWITHPELSQTGPCEICEPRHMRLQGDGWFDPEPPHPRCVCEVRVEIVA